jgi:hypothetical protein
VLFPPPHHSDFQPIGSFLAFIKREVGRQYSEGTTLSMVKERLIAELHKAKDKHDSIADMIETCAGMAKEFFDEDDEDGYEYDDDLESVDSDTDASGSDDDGNQGMDDSIDDFSSEYDLSSDDGGDGEN